MNMNCEEVRQLHDAYLDSELDAKTTLEFREHLANCGECARLLAAEAKLDARLMTSLRQGQRTTALWEQIEQRVITADKTDSRACPSPRAPRAPEWLSAFLWPHPKAWAGLAAVWLVILGLNFAARDTTPGLEARRVKALTNETVRSLKQREQLLAEVSGLPELREADRPKTMPPSPHSARRPELVRA